MNWQTVLYLVLFLALLAIAVGLGLYARRRHAAVVASLRAEIAERQRIEKFVRQNEIKYRTLFESASDAIFLMQGDLFVDCNMRTLSMFGCQRQQIIGQSRFDFRRLNNRMAAARTKKCRRKSSWR